MSSDDEYQPSQEVTLTSPQPREAIVSAAAVKRISVLFQPGGALNSQTTDSQYVDGLMREALPGQSDRRDEHTARPAQSAPASVRTVDKNNQNNAIPKREETNSAVIAELRASLEASHAQTSDLQHQVDGLKAELKHASQQQNEYRSLYTMAHDRVLTLESMLEAAGGEVPLEQQSQYPIEKSSPVRPAKRRRSEGSSSVTVVAANFEDDLSESD